DKSYIEAVEQLGRELARRGHGMVFGGGAQGLMGAAARGVSELGGEIIGVAPTFFNVDGILYQHCTEFVYTETMRQRKQIMEDRSDGFIVLPGGIGTFEEFFEILTLKQLGRHNKPIAIYNIADYYDDISRMLEKAIEQNFMKPQCRSLLGVFDEAAAMLDYFEQYDDEAVDVRHMKNI
ncbi:MAG: TIGR00730 family Rossman fold protein, partial [Clostridia bacterium]|nr:TIGR00730 family Rossman fold protein [Clostridia bacterium]